MDSINSTTSLTRSSSREQPRTLSRCLAAILATGVAIIVGCFINFSSSVLPTLKPNETYFTDIGAVIGALPTNYTNSVFGRIRIINIASSPILFTWIGVAFGHNVLLSQLPRLIGGFAVGLTPMYAVEFSETVIRGSTSTLYRIVITIGLLMGYLLGGIYFDRYGTIFIILSVAVTFAICYYFKHEYIPSRNNEIVVSTRSLRWFKDVNFCDYEERSRHASRWEKIKLLFFDLFYSRATTKALLISMGLVLFQQFSGYNAVLFYAEDILEGSISPSFVRFSTICGSLQVITTLGLVILIDSLKRTTFLLISSILMSLCLVLIGTQMYLRLEVLQFIPVTCLCIYVVAFTVGLGPIPWIIMGEIFTPRLKPAAFSILASLSWPFSFLSNGLVRVFGLSTALLVYGVTCAGFVLFCAAYVPETKDRNIEQIQDMLLDRAEQRTDENPVSPDTYNTM